MTYRIIKKYNGFYYVQKKFLWCWVTPEFSKFSYAFGSTPMPYSSAEEAETAIDKHVKSLEPATIIKTINK